MLRVVCALAVAVASSSTQAPPIPTLMLLDGTQLPVMVLGTAGYNDTVVAEAVQAASTVIRRKRGARAGGHT